MRLVTFSSYHLGGGRGTWDPHLFTMPGNQVVFPVSIGLKLLLAQPEANEDMLNIKTAGKAQFIL